MRQRIQENLSDVEQLYVLEIARQDRQNLLSFAATQDETQSQVLGTEHLLETVRKRMSTINTTTARAQLTHLTNR